MPLPNEIFFQTDLARDGPRVEPRPGITGDAEATKPISLVARHVEGCPHLPVICLDIAA